MLDMFYGVLALKITVLCFFIWICFEMIDFQIEEVELNAYILRGFIFITMAEKQVFYVYYYGKKKGGW